MGDRGTSNHSEMTDFILVGFRVRPELCIFIFLLFLLIYAMIILGNLSFCASRAIDHFYCDTRPLQRLSCSDLLIHKVVSFSLSSIIILPTIIVIIVSYMYIVSTVLNIHSTKGRKKAFSTCSSHLGVVSVLYGAGFFMYLTPNRFPELSKVASLCYSLVTPMLNPLIYSLRNKDVKEALKNLLEKKHTIH
ncbi:olfactory receptor 9K2 [Heterocephalus glaber]|uniref:Olfactory receptor 9K2 n=1 Tax=Heterocephalus glaber TaxID=10181 RepID=A0AAX6QI58_HETGA|nr:olfactory receptor 9K2 [Heterocephalus glaber]